MEVPEGFKKVEADVFKFENEGDSIQGKLLSKEDSASFNNKVYKIESSEDKKVKVVFGTTVLDSEMEIVPVGKEVIIVYTGQKESKKGNNPTKTFDVYVK